MAMGFRPESVTVNNTTQQRGNTMNTVKIAVQSFFTRRDTSGNVYSKACFLNTANGKSVTVNMGWGSSDSTAERSARLILKYAGCADCYYPAVITSKTEDMKRRDWNCIKTIEMPEEIAQLAKALGFRRNQHIKRGGKK